MYGIRRIAGVRPYRGVQNFFGDLALFDKDKNRFPVVDSDPDLLVIRLFMHGQLSFTHRAATVCSTNWSSVTKGG